MKLQILGLILSLSFFATAKPGDSYTLTGREKSIFGIFQADLKAYPKLYVGEDINAYYQTFRSLNNLDDRKLKLGEKLKFPDTAMSKKIKEAAAKEAAEAEAAAARNQAKEPQAAAPAIKTETETSGQVSLFGSDRPSSRRTRFPEAERASVEAAQKNIRHQAIRHFQRKLLPNWMFNYSLDIIENIEKGNISMLTEQALEIVDEQFSKALTLHAYPEQKTFVIQFEKPEKVGEYFFFVIKREESGRLRFYSLERGISFFGAGNSSVLHEWLSVRDFSELGRRTYDDLPNLLKELKDGQAEVPEE